MAADNPGKWAPGQSGNPNGRPPNERSLAKMMREFLDEEVEITRNGEPLKTTNKRRFIEGVFIAAMAGNDKAMRIIFERVDGPVPKEINLNAGNGVQALSLELVREMQSRSEKAESQEAKDAAAIPIAPPDDV